MTVQVEVWRDGRQVAIFPHSGLQAAEDEFGAAIENYRDCEVRLVLHDGTVVHSMQAAPTTHSLEVTLTNPAGERLVWHVTFAWRSTPNDHLGRTVAAEEANHHDGHRRHGPWVASSSRWNT